MRKILAIDVDGVVADLHTTWLNMYNKDWNDNLQTEDIVDWNIHQFTKKECGMLMYDYIENPFIYDYVNPIEGSFKYIPLLREKYRIIFATSSTIGTMGKKYIWLKKHNFIENLDDYTELKDKSLIRANALLDDYHVNLYSFLGKKYLFDSNWNKNKEKNEIIRVYGWENAYLKIMETMS